MKEYAEVAALVGVGILAAMYFDSTIAALLNPVLGFAKLSYNS